jgi:hypothetical protein
MIIAASTASSAKVFVAQLRLIESRDTQPPCEGPDRLLVGARRMRREKACREHHKRAQHGLGRDRPRMWRRAAAPRRERHRLARFDRQRSHRAHFHHAMIVDALMHGSFGGDRCCNAGQSVRRASIGDRQVDERSLQQFRRTVRLSRRDSGTGSRRTMTIDPVARLR